ncbi:putative ankyrin repeat protein RF_0381 [Coccinella septempunctata]|uniref:putative ankyrin repeat protein RF_0381 n=1 Tax=Coccinella septempunctata TaxID=41139 RepID=UPI001D0877AD|nr:putative ankyrin repeat protein RF_0381 [Coccinella septempunctata]
MLSGSLQRRFSNSLKRVRKFVDKRARTGIDAPVDEAYNSALHLAVQKGSHKKVLDLLQRGAYPNVTDQENATPLHMAVQFGHPHLIETLVNYGADVEAERNDSSRPIHLVRDSPKALECLEELLKCGADLNARNATGNNLLQLIVKSEEKDIKLIKKLLDSGIDVNNVDSLRNNCLHTVTGNPAIPHRRARFIAKYLIDYGIDVNAKNMLGETPLHEATAGDNDNIVSMLFRNGVNLDVVNYDEMTAFDMAAECGNVSCLFLMIKYVIINKHRNLPVHESVVRKIESDRDLTRTYRDFEKEFIGLKDKKIFNCSIYDILCRRVDNIVGATEVDNPYEELSKSFVRSSIFYREIVETWNEINRKRN